MMHDCFNGENNVKGPQLSPEFFPMYVHLKNNTENLFRGLGVLFTKINSIPRLLEYFKVAWLSFNCNAVHFSTDLLNKSLRFLNIILQALSREPSWEINGQIKKSRYKTINANWLFITNKGCFIVHVEYVRELLVGMKQVKILVPKYY